MKTESVKLAQPTKADVPRIASVFARYIRRDIKKADLREVIGRNKRATDKTVCHSHDFCDANVCMIQAYEKLGFELPDLESGRGVYAFNAAWDLAKASGFWLDAPPKVDAKVEVYYGAWRRSASTVVTEAKALLDVRVTRTQIIVLSGEITWRENPRAFPFFPKSEFVSKDKRRPVAFFRKNGRRVGGRHTGWTVPASELANIDWEFPR